MLLLLRRATSALDPLPRDLHFNQSLLMLLADSDDAIRQPVGEK